MEAKRRAQLNEAFVKNFLRNMEPARGKAVL
jgi:hypothetical protein